MEEFLDEADLRLPNHLESRFFIGNVISLAATNFRTLFGEFNIPGELANDLLNLYCYASTSIAYKGLEDDESYLFIYTDSLPIQVSFYPGEDNTVVVSLCLIIAEDFPTSAKKIKKYYADLFGKDIADAFELIEMDF